MAKRRTHDSDDRYFDSLDSGDNLIDLTGAFAPVKGPQSVDYDVDDDPVGLTQAFGAVPAPDENERGWSENDKWKGFDWDADYGDHGVDAVGDDEPPASSKPKAEDADKPAAAGETAAKPGNTGALHAVGEKPAKAPRSESGGGSRPRGRHGRHAAPEPEMSPRMQKSRRTRRVLIVLVILLVILIGVVGYFAFRTFTNSQHEATQQAQQQQASSGSSDMIDDIAGDKNADTAVAQTDVPVLNALFGKTSDEAIAAIGHGALVTTNREDSDEKTAVKTNLNVALTDEPADAKSSTPTVYLGLDKDGKVIEVGYSASAGALGFGSLSFADAISTEHVIEKTFGRIGFDVPEGSVALPDDKSKYSTYAKDGTTVERERCSFEGPLNVNGEDCTWSAVLSYDYKTQIHTGNLNDTIRTIYVYVTKNVAP